MKSSHTEQQEVSDAARQRCSGCAGFCGASPVRGHVALNATIGKAEARTNKMRRALQGDIIASGVNVPVDDCKLLKTDCTINCGLNMK